MVNNNGIRQVQRKDLFEKRQLRVNEEEVTYTLYNEFILPNEYKTIKLKINNDNTIYHNLKRSRKHNKQDLLSPPDPTQHNYHSKQA